MKRLFISAALTAALLGTVGTTIAGETLNLDYRYAGNTGVSLSSIAGGPLSVSDFSDARVDAEAADIQRAGKEALTLQKQSAAALVQNTFAQAFESSGAQLGDSDSPLALEGKLIEMQVNESDQGLETLIRVELTLKNQGRTAWQSVVFSRSQTEGDDPGSAIQNGLNRLVTELFRDDYFLMELGIF